MGSRDTGDLRAQGSRSSHICPLSLGYLGYHCHYHFDGTYYVPGNVLSSLHIFIYLRLMQPSEANPVIIPTLQMRDRGKGRLNNLPKVTIMKYK